MTTTYQLIDSSFLYALYNTKTAQHAQALEYAQQAVATPLVPTVILPEVGFLFLRDEGHYGMIQFLKALANSGMELRAITAVDLSRASEIMEAYASAKFDLVDCCVMALAERLSITQICTFDRRDFSIFRPSHCEFYELLP